MATSVELHPDAVEEAADAYAWYASRSEEVAAAFLAELDRVIARVGEDPASLPSHCTARGDARSAVFRIK